MTRKVVQKVSVDSQPKPPHMDDDDDDEDKEEETRRTRGDATADDKQHNLYRTGDSMFSRNADPHDSKSDDADLTSNSIDDDYTAVPYEPGSPQQPRGGSSADHSSMHDKRIKENRNSFNNDDDSRGSANSYTRGENTRDDHRKGSSGYRGADGRSGATSRLHQHISKDPRGPPGPTNSYQEQEQDEEEKPSDYYEDRRTRGGGGGGRARREPRYEDDDSDQDTQGEIRGRAGDSMGVEEEVYGNDLDQEDIEEIKAKKINKIRARQRRTEDTDSDEEEDSSAPRGVVDNRKGPPSSAPPPGATAAVAKSRMMPPSVAPPRRARDGQAEVEALARTSDLGTSLGKMHVSADDFISRKPGVVVNMSTADAKSSSRENSARSTTSGGSGGGGGGGSSDDDDDVGHVDLKAEMQRYASLRNAEESHSGDNISRPPRPKRAVSGSGNQPVSSYSSNSSSSSSSSGSSSSSSSSSGAPCSSSSSRTITTPPRRPSDPGVSVDDNFASDNWDDEDNSPVKADHKSSGGGGEREDAKKSGAVVTGSAVDPNWLSEDFDD